MPEETSSPPSATQQWPCGPECRHAQTLSGSYGEWHWCAHPLVGGRLVRDGHECRHYASAPTAPAQPLRWRQG